MREIAPNTAYRVGRLVGRNFPAWLFGVVAIFLIGYLLQVVYTTPPVTRALSEPTQQVAPTLTLEERCAASMQTSIQEAKAALEKRDHDGVFKALDPCRDSLDAPTKAMLVKAMQDLQKLAAESAKKQRASELATEKLVKAAKKREGVSIGMSQQEVIDSMWGKPRKINRTTNAYGTREQWVYDGNYLYFENGKLTSIQN